MHMDDTYYGVYRVTRDGQHHYVNRTATPNRKLAQDIADGLSRGEVVLPTGQTKRVRPRPHVVKPITRFGADWVIREERV